MLKNYLTIAIRNLWRNKGYSAISILSLAIGLTGALLITLYVRNEWTFDDFHKNKDTIYRVLHESSNPDGSRSIGYFLPQAFGPALAVQVPEVIEYTRLAEYSLGGTRSLVRLGNNVFEENISFVDNSLFRVFTLPLRIGESTSVLAEPYSVVLSEELAIKLFGSVNPIGEIVSVAIPGERFNDYRVTGVMEKIPANSSIKFDLVIPIIHSPGYEHMTTGWNSFSVQTYVQLASWAEPKAVEEKLQALLATPLGGEGGWAALDRDPTERLHLQSLSDVHFSNDYSGQLGDSNPRKAFILAGFAVVILGIGLINYITLAISRTTSRTSEVGVRKVNGAHGGHLFVQFCGESLLVTILALLVAIGITEFVLPAFNDIVQQDLSLRGLDGVVVVISLVLTIIVALMAGSYPAIVIARLDPVNAIKGQGKQMGMTKVSKAMSIFQYSVATGLTACVITMHTQWHFSVDLPDLGFNYENLVVVPMNLSGEKAIASRREGRDPVQEQLALFRNELDQSPQIEELTTVVGTAFGTFPFSTRVVEYNFLNTLGLRLREGEFCSESSDSTPTRSVVVNEAFVASRGWDFPVVGRTLDNGATIIGVIEDYHNTSFHHPIMPMILESSPVLSGSTQLLARIQPGTQQEAIALLRRAWDRIDPGTPFQYSMMEDEIAEAYADDQRWARVVNYAAVLSILIACLGLFGLASLAATRRTKEIGIRKVVGASVTQVVTLLSKEFLVLVLIANVIAWPIAWYVMRRWLENFAYRIDLSWWIFVLAGLLALVIALATVSWQTIRAAMANPVDSLRYE